MTTTDTAVQYEVWVCGECARALNSNEVHGFGYDDDHTGGVEPIMLRMIPARVTDDMIARAVKVPHRARHLGPFKLAEAMLRAALQVPDDR